MAAGISRSHIVREALRGTGSAFGFGAGHGRTVAAIGVSVGVLLTIGLLIGTPAASDVGSVVGLALVMLPLCGFYAVHLSKRKHTGPVKNPIWYAIVLEILLLGVARLLLQFGAEPWVMVLALPAPLVGMLLSVIYDRRFAFEAVLMTGAAMGAMAAAGMSGTPLEAGQYIAFAAPIVGAIVAVLPPPGALRTHSLLFATGLVSGMTAAGALVALNVMCVPPTSGGDWLELGKTAGIAVCQGGVTGMLVTSLIPVLERVLRVITEYRLHQLADGRHPLLTQMLEIAPGTYSHSMNVARLAAAGAEAIGANATVTMVGAMFHDIGKMVRPHYFTENEPDSSMYHGKLPPAMSAMIIIAHVTDGIQMARDHRLPPLMEDFIAGHHGTSLIRFFHEKAKYQAEVSGEDPTRVPEGQFRYPGPKPQSREAAVVAIADHVEASSRARLEGKQTPATIRRFVRGIIREKRDDGQFDECDLTTRDLALIEDAITRVLSSMFHHRVKYPESGDTKKAKQAAFEKELHKQERAAAKTKEKMLTQ